MNKTKQNEKNKSNDFSCVVFCSRHVGINADDAIFELQNNVSNNSADQDGFLFSLTSTQRTRYIRGEGKEK